MLFKRFLLSTFKEIKQKSWDQVEILWGNKKSICFVIGNNQYEYPCHQAYETFVRLILSEGFLEYFEFIDGHSSESGLLNIYLETASIFKLITADIKTYM